DSGFYICTNSCTLTIVFSVIFAFLWTSFNLKRHPIKTLTHIIDGIGVFCIFILLLLFYKVNDNCDWIYNGGFYLISVMTLFVIMSVVHPSGYFAKVIGNPIFVMIGKRSYSLYLWHFPVISFVHS